MMIAKKDWDTPNTESPNILITREICGTFKKMSVATKGGL